MPSFISSQRRNVDRLLALILLWNVIGGLFVTLGTPWLSEIAQADPVRSPDVPPSGYGWLAIGLPTHYAGLWLTALGVYALHRMRRHLRWELAAVLFYAPQTYAILSPVHVDMWIGLFAATSFQSVAINWIAIVLLLAHAWLMLLDTKFPAYLTRMSTVPINLPAVAVNVSPIVRLPTVVVSPWTVLTKLWAAVVNLPPVARLRTAARSLSRILFGVTPLSRSALSRRYATIATITASVFLPLVGWVEVIRSPLLLLPVTFVAAYVVAFVWSGGQREPRFSEKRGAVGSLLTYVYMGMAADLLSRWPDDGRIPVFRFFLVMWVYLIPYILLVPVIGAIAGDWLGKRVAAPEENNRDRSSRLTAAMWLTLLTPLLAFALSYALEAPQRQRIETARVVAQRALEHFDRNEPEQLYAMFTPESRDMIDRAAFVTTLRERRETVGGLRYSDARSEKRHQWYPRAGIVQFDFYRLGDNGKSSDSSESIVIDVRGLSPMVSALSMSFENPLTAPDILVPRRDCGGKHEKLHCGHDDDLPPRSLF
ncbi:MAG TPA: hypothetical protein VGD45_30185 [Steroidobacter sp.]|uniref:hypothetical protein n=1 Tax=Steroidobacter sp. TaxID=1978227 RepID=UPI002ED85417